MMNPSNYWTAALLAGAMFVAGAGCAQTGRNAVPVDARELGSGRGELTARATESGRIWIIDQTDNKLVWSGEVRRDDRILVDPADGRIQVGGETVAERPLNREHRYTIYDRQP